MRKHLIVTLLLWILTKYLLLYPVTFVNKISIEYKNDWRISIIYHIKKAGNVFELPEIKKNLRTTFFVAKMLKSNAMRPEYKSNTFPRCNNEFFKLPSSETYFLWGLYIIEIASWKESSSQLILFCIYLNFFYL